MNFKYVCKILCIYEYMYMYYGIFLEDVKLKCIFERFEKCFFDNV